MSRVALETALLSLGLPYPENIEVFRAMEAAVRESGATPVGIALHEGKVHVGLSDKLVDHMARAKDVKKCARRDIGWILEAGHTGATTVSSTLWLAHRAGIGVFATGGIGGVHPGHGGPPDISADLATLAEVPMIIVSTGTKTICDAEATAELLEALSVPVVGLGTDRFPHFYGGPSATAIPRVDSPLAAARSHLQHLKHGGTATTFVANPCPESHLLDPKLLSKLTSEGARAAARDGVSGNALTPYLLDYLARKSKGRTVAANRALLVHNARIAGQVAVATATRSRASGSRSAAPRSRRR